MKNLRKN